MDSLAALSVVASIISMLQLSKDAVNICSELVETGSVSQYRVVEETTENLGLYTHNATYYCCRLPST